MLLRRLLRRLRYLYSLCVPELLRGWYHKVGLRSALHDYHRQELRNLYTFCLQPTTRGCLLRSAAVNSSSSMISWLSKKNEHNRVRSTDKPLSRQEFGVEADTLGGYVVGCQR